MGFLRDEHLAIQAMARKFTENEVIPIANELDRQGKTIPEEIIQKMADLGIYGLSIPEEYGGAGLDPLSVAVVTEELSRGWLSVGSVNARNLLCGDVLLKGGNEEQKRRYLPKMASGEIQTATAGTEAEAGSDAANVQLRAVRKGDKYVLNGSKMFCTFSDRAELLFVYARTDPNIKPKHKGISCFLVEKPQGDGFMPPYITGKHIECVGYHGMRTYELHFEDCEVPVENLLGGEEGQGFYQLMKAYEIGRIHVTFRAVGVARAAYEAALAYSQQRVQFEQTISKFQAVRFALADMATEIEAARQLGYYAADKLEHGERCDLECGMAKLFATEMADKITYKALHIHGGYGYTMEFPVQRYWRDSRLLTIGEGPSEIQREVIARRLIGR